MAKLPLGFIKRPDGRLEYRFTVNGKRRSTYGWSITEAREKAQKKRQEIEMGLATRGRSVTLRDYVSQWIESKEGTIKDSSIQSYKRSFPTMLEIQINKKCFGDMRIVDIETQDVRTVQKAIAEVNTVHTTNHYIGLLCSVMRSAVNDDRLITFNPVTPVKALRDSRPLARENIHRALTKDETNAFFENCGDSWYELLFRFLLLTGCRIGEAGALQVRDVHREEVAILRTLTKTGEGLIIGDSTKTESGRRAIPLSDELREVISQQRKKNIVFGNVESITDTIFKTTRGGVLYNGTINNEIRKICRQAGIEGFTAHAFRDTFATRCVESGMNFKTLQTIMGHSDIRMTMNLYAHVMKDTKREELQAVNFY